MRALLAVALVAITVLAPAASSRAVPTEPAVATDHASPNDAARDQEYWLDDYGIGDAWSVTRGAGVTIAIIDTGVARVADLGDAVVGGTDFSGLGAADGRTPVGRDLPSHGTMVASLLAGRGTGAGTGVIGSAPEASILSISMSFGAGARDSDTQVADAVTWAVDHGADVINLSLTRNTLEWPPSWDTAFLYAAQHDVVVVAAAGNRGNGTEEVGAPATMPGVLTVGGVDRNGVASAKASSQGITIAVAAPSEGLVGVTPSGSVVTWAGTSGATPIVAGIVALVRAAHPELDAANVINRLIATARDAGPPGDDFTYGFGYVDAAAAVSADVPTVTANPMGDLADWIRVNRRAAAATPEPTDTFQPTPQAVPEDGVADPTGTLLPRLTNLQVYGLPALVLAILAFVAGGLTVAAVRRFRPPRAR
ncbi:MAG: S8 family serine peptidase [Pseudolysinimonas sp.]|uniref:S8 family peptidase n=1 Tax=Pseudolysinimonas sp. TaxID=2680009 RepID=UPI0032633D66